MHSGYDSANGQHTDQTGRFSIYEDPCDTRGTQEGWVAVRLEGDPAPCTVPEDNSDGW